MTRQREEGVKQGWRKKTPRAVQAKMSLESARGAAGEACLVSDAEADRRDSRLCARLAGLWCSAAFREVGGVVASGGGPACVSIPVDGQGRRPGQVPLRRCALARLWAAAGGPRRRVCCGRGGCPPACRCCPWLGWCSCVYFWVSVLSLACHGRGGLCHLFFFFLVCWSSSVRIYFFFFFPLVASITSPPRVPDTTSRSGGPPSGALRRPCPHTRRRGAGEPSRRRERHRGRHWTPHRLPALVVPRRPVARTPQTCILCFA